MSEKFNFFDRAQQKERAKAAAAVQAMNDSEAPQTTTTTDEYIDEPLTNTTVVFDKTPEEIALQEKKRQELKEKMPWVEKYRPETLSDVISHQKILHTIDKLIGYGGIPHLLLHGPPGTGKTSTALAIARKINGARDMKRMVLELNASDERGIDTVRDKIKQFAGARHIMKGSTGSGIKLVILDEADSMTRVAQFALRRVMEMYSKTTRFIIIANYVNKIIPALQSRCTCFRFAPLDKISVLEHLKMVAHKESLIYDDAGLDAVISLSRGDMRMCLNIMQSCLAAYGKLDVNTVYQCTGAPRPNDIEKLVQIMLSDNYTTAYQYISTLSVTNGLSLIDILTCIHDIILRYNMPDGVLAFILIQLSNIESALTKGATDKLQLPAIIGIFQLAREMLAQDTSNHNNISLIKSKE